MSVGLHYPAWPSQNQPQCFVARKMSNPGLHGSLALAEAKRRVFPTESGVFWTSVGHGRFVGYDFILCKDETEYLEAWNSGTCIDAHLLTVMRLYEMADEVTEPVTAP